MSRSQLRIEPKTSWLLIRHSYHYKLVDALGKGAEDVLSVDLSWVQLILSLWRFPVDGIVSLGGLTVQAYCLSEYSHYRPPPRPPAPLSPMLNGLEVTWMKLNYPIETLVLLAVIISLGHTKPIKWRRYLSTENIEKTLYTVWYFIIFLPHIRPCQW